jgi:hypothetical protein
MRATALISASAGILLILLLLSAGCGQRPTTGNNGGFQPFWGTKETEATPVPTTPDVGVVVEVPQETVQPTTPPTPRSTEPTYVEVYNKELPFKGNVSVLEYELKNPPLLLDFSMKPIILTGTAVERDPTCSPTDTNLCLRTVTKTYPDPNAWFTATVTDLGTYRIVGKTGYGRDYDVAVNKSLTIKNPGNYRIEMSGNRLSAVVRMRVSTTPPAATTQTTPPPTTTTVITTTAPADQGVKIIGISFPQQSGNDLHIPYAGGRRDDPQLSYITVIIADTMTLNTINSNGDLGTGPGVKPSANTVLTKEGVLTPGYDHIEVIGHFADGSEQRFFDTMV